MQTRMEVGYFSSSRCSFCLNSSNKCRNSSNCGSSSSRRKRMMMIVRRVWKVTYGKACNAMRTVCKSTQVL